MCGPVIEPETFCVANVQPAPQPLGAVYTIFIENLRCSAVEVLWQSAAQWFASV